MSARHLPHSGPVCSANRRSAAGTTAARLARTGGASTTEMLVVAGIIVTTILIVLGIFRQEVVTGMQAFGRCTKAVLSGNPSGCSSSPPAQAAGSGQQLPPGVTVRNTGLARGLVTNAPGMPGAGSTGRGGAGQGQAGRGAGGAPGGGGQDALGGAGGARGGPGGARGELAGLASGSATGIAAGLASVPPPADPKALADARAQLASYNRRRNMGKPDDPSWQESAVRLWNATSLFSSNRNLVANQDQLNEMATRAGDKAAQWAQIAEQRLNSGDLQGFQDAMRRSRQYDMASNRMRGNAASVLADAADQAMTEAAHIRQISFETASAIGNPTGYLTGKVTGYVVGTAADYVLPDGRIKQVVVGVASAAAAAYAGGMTPQAWQSFGAAGQTATNVLGTGLSVTGQSAAMAVGIADTVTSVTTTYSTQGGKEAAWEVATALITHGVMNTKVTGLGDADGNPRSLNDYLSQAPSAAAVRETLENNVVPLGQLEVNSQNLAALGQNAYNRATGNDKRDPLSFAALPPDAGYVKTFNETPDPQLTQAQRDMAASMGQTPELATAKAKHAQITGGTFFDRATQLEATQLIQNQQAVGKGTEQHQKSAGDRAPWLPMDTMESKIGDQVRNAKTPEQQAAAQKAYDYNEASIHEAVSHGKVTAGPPPPGDTRIKGDIAYDPRSGLPWVGDVDPVTNNLSRPTDPVRDGGVTGLGTYRELQDVSNIKSSLAPHHLETTANHGHGGRNPGHEPLPDKVIRYTPDGQITVIEGQVNVLNAIREAGCPEHPSWGAQAQQAMQNNPGGPQLINAPANPPTPFNQRPTVQQAALANNRNTIRTNYVIRTQLATMNTRPTDEAKEPGGMQSLSSLRWNRSPLAVPHLTLARSRPSDWRFGHSDAVRTRAVTGAGVWRMLRAQASAQAARVGQPDPRTQADLASNRLWGIGLNKALDQYGETWEDKQILVHLKAYQQIRDLALDEFQTSERVDMFVRWAFGLLAGSPQSLPTTNQSALFERIDAHAAPAWRGDLDAWREHGLHYGLVQHYSEQALALAERAPYPSYGPQKSIARAFVSAAGEATVRRAYFHGDTWELYRTLGSKLGATADEAITRGLAFVQQLNLAAMTEDLPQAERLLRQIPGAGINPARGPDAAAPLYPRRS
ncbi:MAG: hypothetical protein AB1806_09095 [Acidobacteriota bacterium]